MRKLLVFSVILTFLLPHFLTPVLAEVPAPAATSEATSTRLAGTDRFLTALKISQAGWPISADVVVLARGDNFPDALAGAVLAKKMNAPLLLTDSDHLRPEVQTELERLKPSNVYLLGSRMVLSSSIETVLTTLKINFQRLQGADRYGTAADIARTTGAPNNEVFLVAGDKFADALSISSYAAAHTIPILMTDVDRLPEPTTQILTELQIKKITIIGSPGVVSSPLEASLKDAGYSVDRIFGPDRYQTNLHVIQTLGFDRTGAFFATGENFPDALAGAVLAAQQAQPIFLIQDKLIPDQTLTYLNTLRSQIQQYTIFGSYALIPYGTESILHTSSLRPRISLQYWQAYSYAGYQNQLALIPGKATDTVDFISPNWYSLNTIPSGQTVADGSFSGSYSQNDYVQLVKAAQGRGLKVLPIIASAWNDVGRAAVDSMLTNPASRTKLIAGLVQMLQETGSDGIVLDFEFMSDASGPYLTQFTRELSVQLKAQNKLLVMAVMSRTSATDWYPEFDYSQLAQHVDYLNIMTYDYSTSAPGPIAPLDWVKKVLDYTKSQGVPLNKVLLGIPYYGRDWTTTGNTYTASSASLSSALATAATYQVTPQRATTAGDSVGIPTYTYTDANQALHTVYYEDPLSWEAKLTLLDQYGLGGIASWSLYWLNKDTATQLFPLLQRHLR